MKTNQPHGIVRLYNTFPFYEFNEGLLIIYIKIIILELYFLMEIIIKDDNKMAKEMEKVNM